MNDSSAARGSLRLSPGLSTSRLPGEAGQGRTRRTTRTRRSAEPVFDGLRERRRTPAHRFEGPSKPVRRRNPPLGRFDSCAAPCQNSRCRDPASGVCNEPTQAGSPSGLRCLFGRVADPSSRALVYKPSTELSSSFTRESRWFDPSRAHCVPRFVSGLASTFVDKPSDALATVATSWPPLPPVPGGPAGVTGWGTRLGALRPRVLQSADTRDVRRAS
jgi:hypothetical protein